MIDRLCLLCPPGRPAARPPRLPARDKRVAAPARAGRAAGRRRRQTGTKFGQIWGPIGAAFN